MQELKELIGMYKYILIIEAIAVCGVIEIIKRFVTYFLVYNLGIKEKKIKYSFGIASLIIGLTLGFLLCYSNNYNGIDAYILISLGMSGLIGIIYMFLFYPIIRAIKKKMINDK